jgi:hypothetical protein
MSLATIGIQTPDHAAQSPVSMPTTLTPVIIIVIIIIIKQRFYFFNFYFKIRNSPAKCASATTSSLSILSYSKEVFFCFKVCYVIMMIFFIWGNSLQWATTADPSLRPRGQWDRHLSPLPSHISCHQFLMFQY